MPFGITSFDELNKMVGVKRSLPFEEYFRPMKISEKQKKERMRLARLLEEEFLYMMSYMFYAYPTINMDMANELRERYIRQLELLGIATTAAKAQAAKFAIEAVESTQRHKEDPYFYSEDRARLCAEDQSCFVGDINDYADALDGGKGFKTWQTVGDNRVRFSHEEVEGLTLPIEEPFELAGGLLQYPHDSSWGCDPSEISGCRCTLSYS